MKNKIKVHDVKPQRNDRRQFLKMSGIALAGSGLLLMGCSDDESPMTDPDPDPDPDPTTPFDLGTGNLGILNYAYALEQLEADFYTRVVNNSSFSSTFNDEEKAVLLDLYYHEIIHRDFFSTAINAAVNNDTSKVLPELEFDYGSLNFGNRQQVLETSKVLEDTGVAAYNGAGKLIDVSNAAGQTYLLLAGKIVSVEARHASAIRSLLNPGSTDFAGDDILVGLNGTAPAFDKATSPADIIAAVSGLNIIQTPFTYMEQGVG